MYDRPGQVFYCDAATKQVNHGAPVIETSVPGIAMKTKNPGSLDLPTATNVIAVGEAFTIDLYGEFEVATLASAAKGDRVWITVATNALTRTGPTSEGTTNKFGRIVTLPGERGCPTTSCRINTHLRDSFA